MRFRDHASGAFELILTIANSPAFRFPNQRKRANGCTLAFDWKLFTSKAWLAALLFRRGYAHGIPFPVASLLYPIIFSVYPFIIHISPFEFWGKRRHIYSCKAIMPSQGKDAEMLNFIRKTHTNANSGVRDAEFAAFTARRSKFLFSCRGSPGCQNA
jgi:hypothetical protein